MAAKGSILKQEIASKILAAFPGSFLYNDGKEIRINGTENGEKLQIKLTLTAAKVAVEGGSDVALPGEAATADVKPNVTNETSQSSNTTNNTENTDTNSNINTNNNTSNELSNTNNN